MKILVIGGGGREHALAWKAAQGENIEQVFVAPGNAGTSAEPKVTNVDIAADDVGGLLSFAKDSNIDLTIVGPEAPLVLGVVDVFSDAGLAIFGPTKGAAQLEGSKAFSKDFLSRHNIPTAAYANFTDISEAKAYVEQQGTPIVIKADGLAAGKGVIIAETKEQAFAAIDDMLADNKFGDAGSRVVIEEFLIGEEASFIVMADGKNILPLATSQDHKARDDGDLGPNTGGMGAYSPAPVVTPEIHAKVMQQVIEPTIRGMEQEGHSYTGFLYAGLMIGLDGSIKVLEFNCRFGDPETQPIMMRMKSDLVKLCNAACKGELNRMTCEWDPRAALGVVMAADGYPESYAKGAQIFGLDDNSVADTKVFHAGTKIDGSAVVTSGGRVLCVVGLGDSVTEAQSTAYARTKRINWNGFFIRHDIGYRAIDREKS